jgi:hypothetical protein
MYVYVCGCVMCDMGCEWVRRDCQVSGKSGFRRKSAMWYVVLDGGGVVNMGSSNG